MCLNRKHLINRIKRKGRSEAMLLKYSVYNYTCFVKEALVDFEADATIKNPQHRLLGDENIHILPTIAIFGANASGKSYILQSISAMINAILNSNTTMFCEMYPKPSIPFAFDEEQRKQPTGYAMTLLIRNHVYKYSFELFGDIVVSEKLSYVQKHIYIESDFKNEILLFKRDNNVIDIPPDINGYSDIAIHCKDYINDVTLFISALQKQYQINVDNENPIRNILDWAENSMYFAPKLMPLDEICGEGAVSWFKENLNNNEVFGITKSIINEFDKQIINVAVTEDAAENDINIYSIHSIVNSNVRNEDDFPFIYESEGTKKTFALLPDILTKMANGGFVMIDELDSQLHPMLLKRIIKLCKDAMYNKGEGQLIFSAHNPSILDKKDLRIDEVYFTQKDISGKSEIYSLLDYYNTDPKLRSDDYDSGEWGKDYLLGRYGAIPYSEEMDVCETEKHEKS